MRRLTVAIVTLVLALGSAAVWAQQMAARAQLEQMRRALPPGVMPPGAGDEGPQPPRGSGPYL